jgi:hypothetical protein
VPSILIEGKAVPSPSSPQIQNPKEPLVFLLFYEREREREA